MINIALTLATKAHRYQKYQDTPYIMHCMRVAMAVEDKWGYDENLIAAALLHDVLEDSDYSQTDLLKAGVYFDVAHLVHILTYYPYESYWEYIDRVCQNQEATKIKYCDMSDNIRHLGKLTITNPGRAIKLTKKYTKAIVKLAEVLK